MNMNIKSMFLNRQKNENVPEKVKDRRYETYSRGWITQSGSKCVPYKMFMDIGGIRAALILIMTKTIHDTFLNEV